MRRVKFIHFLSLLLAVSLSALMPAAAQSAEDGDSVERIRLYDAQITVNEDSTMRVRETIEVVAAADRIRHGIYRDFPTRYRDHLGNRYSVGFNIVSVLRDGHEEPYHTTGIDGGIRIYFGSSDRDLEPGPHTYVFTYDTSRQLGFFDDHDELYWNVNGNGWIFPADRVTATVVLPSKVRRAITGLKAFTGSAGEKGSDYTKARDDDGNPVFRAQNLAPHAGLSIVVGWPKGLVAEPTREQRVRWFLDDNKAVLAGMLGLILILLYYIVAWMAVGRDPKTGTIMPLYEPPDNISPAATRYLKRMKFDDKTYTSAILDLAAKGYATIIRDDDGKYSLSRQPQSGQAEARLSPDEQALTRNLFDGRDTVVFKQSNHTVIAGSRKAVKLNLKTTLEKVYFLNNTGYIVPGIILTVLTFAALVGMDMVNQGAVMLFMMVWLSAWTVGVTALLKGVSQAWKSVKADGLMRGSAQAIPLTLFSIPFVLGEIIGLGVLFWSAGLAVATIMALALGSNALFHHLLKAPTRAGRQLLDRVEGFKMFLSAVDAQRLNTMSPPDKTPELFERFLPYALALGVEHAWAEQFTEVLAAAGQAGRGYSPSWYVGAGTGAFSASSFASSFGDSFSSAVSSSSSAPGSSSGFSGGGSSGGGGGGGGGGGW
jgi:uncharacterized membrane protein YgcG